MRSVVACLLALLLLTFVPEGRSGPPVPAPLDLFGGGEYMTSWAPPALLVEAYYRTLRDDEYVGIANTQGSPLDLGGWSLTDGEGTLRFPLGSMIDAGDRIVVARNATAYSEDTLMEAEFRYGGGTGIEMLRTGTFRLNDAGDEVILRNATDRPIDVFAYGASNYVGEGWLGPNAVPVGSGNVARRAFDRAWQDRNTSADWDLVRVWSLGQSEFASAAFDFSGTVHAFVTPDAGTTPLVDLLSRAKTIDLSLYTFSNHALLDALDRAAAEHGARIRLLLEGAPVGGITEDEWTLVQHLADIADIRFLVDNTALDTQERYRFGHAKYGILDGETVLVSTENFGDAFPPGPIVGSRGWVVAVSHVPLAAYFSEVFESDFDARRRDVLRFAEMSASPVESPPTPLDPRTPTFLPATITGEFRVIPVIAPDTSLAQDTIIHILRSAATSIQVELFYAHTEWGPFPNLYLEELLTAARRGVSVRLLLDASSYNIEDEDPIDNDDTVAAANAIAAQQGLDFSAKLVDLSSHGFTRLHTKGLIVDGRWSLISSINWNRNSPTANREAGLLIENVDLASYFGAVFRWDWKDDVTPPVADAGPDRAVLVGETVTFRGVGSTDDDRIVNWSWDLDGDGQEDAWGPEVLHVYEKTGKHAVRLRVADAWENMAIDVTNLTVQPPAAAAPTFYPWAICLVAVAVLLWFARMRSRRQRINTPPWMGNRGRSNRATDILRRRGREVRVLSAHLVAQPPRHRRGGRTDC